MAEIVRMPKLSDTMTEGVVAEWHKKVGDTVKEGELLAEIESDKATMEFESFQDGILLYIGVENGKAAPVDSILAILGEKGEDIQTLLNAEVSKPIPAPAEEPAEQTVKKTEKSDIPAQKAAQAPKAAAPVARESALPSSTNGRIKASPLAKRMADEKGIDMARVSGTGTGGRIVKRDIDASTSRGRTQPSAVEGFEDVDISQMRKAIARRLAESKFTSPHFYLTMKIDMEAMISARKSVNEVATMKISHNDLVIRACAAALKKHPKVNASWLDDRIRYYSHVHIGVAVAVEDGLLVPVIRFADTKRLSQISLEVKDLVLRAHDRKLQPEDWQGNTFTVSNLGMFGIEAFTAIINPPDSCIMAVGGIEEVPVVRNGQIVPGQVMRVTLSCDHRVVDGVAGSQFLNTFKHLMENPVILLGEDSI